MEFFLDTADLEEIKSLASFGLVDGITTNPSILAQNNSKSFNETIQSICDAFKGPVSVEVTARYYDEMIKQGKHILEIAPNIVLKLPTTWDGIRACKYFSSKSHKVNMTLCFSVTQAILAAKAGAYYVSLFIGRIDDIGYDGIKVIGEIKDIFGYYSSINTKILGSSIRNVYHVYKAAKKGIDIVTIAPTIMKKLIDNPMTEMGLKQFEDQWNKSGLNILEK